MSFSILDRSGNVLGTAKSFVGAQSKLRATKGYAIVDCAEFKDVWKRGKGWTRDETLWSKAFCITP